MLSWKKLKPVVIACCWLTVIYFSPHFFARFCVHEGRMLSNESIVEQTAQWIIENEHPNAKIEPGGIFENDVMVENGEVVALLEVGKFDLFDPLKPDYPNRVYVFAGGNMFFIFDACGELLGGTM